MAIYRLTVYHQKKRLGHFESDTPHSQQAVQALTRHLSTDPDFSFELHVAHSERRIIEADSQGMRILAREPQFRGVELTVLESKV